MSIGWFDAFRENGAPTWYGENPTPVVLDLQIAALLSLFVIPTIAFLLILPGVRRYRALSAFTFLFSMAVGATICVSIAYPAWHSGQLRIFTAYRAHSRERINAVLGVSIGLTHVNITLKSESPSPEVILLRRTLSSTSPASSAAKDGPDGAMDLLLFGTEPSNASTSAPNSSDKSAPGLSTTASIREGEEDTPEPELSYNERFDFDDVSEMEVNQWLDKGLPYPILRAVEYLSVDRTGFVWGKQYRLAGYYTNAALWLAFSLWMLQMVMLCLLPHHFGQVTLCCGLATLFADFLYAWHTPGDLFLVYSGPDEHPHKLTFRPSDCFFATLGTGLASTAVGGLLWLLEARSAFRLDTVFSAYLDQLCRAHPSRAGPPPLLLCCAPSSASRPRRRRPSLLTPRGSFTDHCGVRERTVGWKRRRRTVRREPRELDVAELARRTAARAGGTVLPQPTQVISPADTLHSERRKQQQPPQRCPSSTSTRPIGGGSSPDDSNTISHPASPTACSCSPTPSALSSMFSFEGGGSKRSTRDPDDVV